MSIKPAYKARAEVRLRVSAVCKKPACRDGREAFVPMCNSSRGFRVITFPILIPDVYESKSSRRENAERAACLLVPD